MNLSSEGNVKRTVGHTCGRQRPAQRRLEQSSAFKVRLTHTGTDTRNTGRLTLTTNTSQQSPETHRETWQRQEWLTLFPWAERAGVQSIWLCLKSLVNLYIVSLPFWSAAKMFSEFLCSLYSTFIVSHNASWKFVCNQWSITEQYIPSCIALANWDKQVYFYI